MRRFAGAMLAAGFAAATLVPLMLIAAASGASAGQSGPATPSPTTSSSQKPSRPGKTPSTPTPTPTQRAVPTGPPAPVEGMPKPSPNCVSQRGRSHLTSEPWAQRALDFSSVWDLTRGQHVTVAVVDSGIDYTPQLAGRVTRTDLTGGNGEDCVPHGTIVASIIAASDARSKGVPFYGVAPAAHILAIRVQQQEDTGSLSVAARRRTLLNIANGIHYAVAEHAKVINVSIQVSASYPALRAAVEFALHHNVVVVAAAGNDSPGGGQGPFYPASYPGVLSVNAVGQNGQLGDFDVSGTPVSVTAPGVDVASDYPGGFDPANNGTSFATAFVSGEAALVRAAYPRLSAAQVVYRIPHDGRRRGRRAYGCGDDQSGAGGHRGAAAAIRRGGLPGSRVPVPRPSGVSSATRTVAFSVTGGAVGVAALVAIGAVVVPQGRRRRWRAGRLGSAPVPAAPAGTGPGPAARPEPQPSPGPNEQPEPGEQARDRPSSPTERAARPEPATGPEREPTPSAPPCLVSFPGRASFPEPAGFRGPASFRRASNRRRRSGPPPAPAPASHPHPDTSHRLPDTGRPRPPSLPHLGSSAPTATPPIPASHPLPGTGRPPRPPSLPHPPSLPRPGSGSPTATSPPRTSRRQPGGRARGGSRRPASPPRSRHHPRPGSRAERGTADADNRRDNRPSQPPLTTAAGTPAGVTDRGYRLPAVCGLVANAVCTSNGSCRRVAR